jgi:hypothetical protein
MDKLDGLDEGSKGSCLERFSRIRADGQRRSRHLESGRSCMRPRKRTTLTSEATKLVPVGPSLARVQPCIAVSRVHTALYEGLYNLNN